MDNVIVGSTAAVCFVMAQMSTNWFESITPLGIVALVVYYFLWKFDKKLDVVDDRTREILRDVNDIRNQVEEHNDHANT